MDANTITAICATIIAVASLAVTVYQARATRLHNRHTLRPILQLRLVLITGGPSGLLLINTGPGPAIITGSQVWLDGKPVGPWERGAARKVRYFIDPYPCAYGLLDRMSLEPGYEAFLIEMENFDREAHAQFGRLVEHRLDIEIRYESLYGGEGYVVTTRSTAWRKATLRVPDPSVPPRPLAAPLATADCTNRPATGCER
ncbi:hypothetical protein [Nonomuraea gerenzanensis]|uniref:hypothetical protein n=1 Tax=Nonomuraea gerenzanensis TaxID=93944 RepID=UPI001CDA3B71|nr:hypothetical protein [Nonomuraea gerenzanensis]UBU09982.1 hypothetical protein LCN96_37275 [Nonomuraea gerenzanensis]